jgi:hypothetical protein
MPLQTNLRKKLTIRPRDNKENRVGRRSTPRKLLFWEFGGTEEHHEKLISVAGNPTEIERTKQGRKICTQVGGGGEGEEKKSVRIKNKTEKAYSLEETEIQRCSCHITFSIVTSYSSLL